MSTEELLTSRQQDVYFLILKGKSNQEIADKLKITLDTVKIHCKAIFRATGAPSRDYLLAWRIAQLEKQLRQQARRK